MTPSGTALWEAWRPAVLHAAAVLAEALAVLVAAHFAIRLGYSVIDRLSKKGDNRFTMLEEARGATLVALLRSVLRYVVDFLAGVTALALMGVPIGGLVAGAGLAGLAIGFGAQNLVRDIIAGFFIILEDQFRVGETVQTAGVFGTVEEIGFRVTKIRDFGGQEHWIPNGKIDQVANYSRGDMRVLLTVAVPYAEDPARVEAVLAKACEEFARTSEVMVEGPSVLGISKMEGSAMEFTIWGKSRNGEQWSVERGLRRALRAALDDAGIPAPYPRVHLAGGNPDDASRSGPSPSAGPEPS